MVFGGKNNKFNSPQNRKVIQLLDALTQKTTPWGINMNQLPGKLQKFKLLVIGITHVPMEEKILPKELG
jgi:hypothetical protein